MPRKLTANEIKRRLFERYGDLIVIDLSTYQGTYKRARFIHKVYGEWWTQAGHVLDGKSVRPRFVGIDYLKKQLWCVHGDLVSVVESTYKNMSTKCCFVDKQYGEWWAKPENVITLGNRHPSGKKERCKKTCLGKYGVDNVSKSDDIKFKKRKIFFTKYGVENPFQDPHIKQKIKESVIAKYGVDHPIKNSEVRFKQAVSANHIKLLIHWFSREDIRCQGSYEYKTVEYLNNNNIDYNWQVQTFIMPDGRTYTPDLYLPDRDLWVEIKGYFWDDAKEKWNWFHKEYPNSEIWTNVELRKIGIKVR